MKPFLIQCSYVLQSHSHVHSGQGFLLLLVSVLFALYMVAAVIRWQRTKQCHYGRVACFITGCLVAGICFSPPLVDFAHHRFSGHMLQHLLLGMLAPVLMVAGAPVLLALSVLPPKGSRLLSKVLGSSGFHFISHPLTTLVLNTGALYLLYLTPLYNRVHDNTALYNLVHVHFLAAGYLFTWAMIGADPAPRRPKLLTRIAVLFLSIAAHSYLSKVMFAYNYPRYSVHSEAEIQEGAKLMYYGGDGIELLLVILLFVRWYQKKGKPHYRLSLNVRAR
jgi:putative membrane protein